MLSAEPVCSCAHFFVHIAHETAGAARTWSSLRPLIFEGEEFLHNSGASRREIVELCPLTVSARSVSDEAIHTTIAARWIASRSLSSGPHTRDPLVRNDGLMHKSSKPLAQEFRILQPIPPRQIDGLGEADPHAGDDGHLASPRMQRERGLIERQLAMFDGDAE